MRCPICNYNFSVEFVEFSENEISQGGKNESCPWCEWLLWIPIKGEPSLVPIPVILSGKKSKGEER